jgi:hypothetical protein
MVDVADCDVAEREAPTTDDTTARTTVLDVFLRAGISEERFREHLAEGRVVADGHQVTDPAMAVERPGTVGLGLSGH